MTALKFLNPDKNLVLNDKVWALNFTVVQTERL